MSGRADAEAIGSGFYHGNSRLVIFDSTAGFDSHIFADNPSHESYVFYGCAAG